ncbi:MAG TPA: hypothetical protein DFS52_14850, partial [Myxococcales bacterium]|nr:hypothetical protein [Myxococcales bacterium]
MLKLSLRTMLAALAVVLPGLAHAADVTGELTGDTVWYASASPYRMIGDVTIPPGITLTIEPGVTVTTTGSDNQLSYDTSKVELIVRGTLKVGVTAAGQSDPSLPVVFRGTGSIGYWGGILFEAGSSGHVFKNAEVAYATTGIKTEATAGLTLEDVVVHRCNRYGLWVASPSASLTLRGSVPTTPGPAKAAVHTCTSSGSSYTGIYSIGALTLTNVDVHSNYYGGIYSAGNSQITGCNIYNNGKGGGSYPYGVVWNGALANGNQTLSRNTIWDNYFGGVYANQSASGLTYLIEHNTIDRNDDYSSSTYGIYVYAASTGSSVTIRDNIITNNKTYGIYGRSNVTAHHNLVWNHSTDYYSVSAGEGAVGCNPLFVAGTGSNYRITSNSPARLADSLAPQRDLGALVYINDPTPGLQGILRQNTTLTAAESPHPMPGDLIVATGVTLTVEPGAVVQPASSDNMKCGYDTARTELIVEGGLSAAGTAASPITFAPASTSSGAWYGLRLENGSTPGTLSYVEIARGRNCVHTDASSLVLSHSKVHHCSETGVTVGLTTSSLTVTGSLATSSISDNGRWGIDNSGALTLVTSSVLRNYYGGVYSDGNSQLTGNELAHNGQGNSGSGFGVHFYNALPNGNQSMSRNLVHRNYAGGLRIDARTSGITDLVEHNTFDNNDLYSSTSYELYAYVTSGTVTVRDNILTNNDYYGVYRYSSGGTFDIHHNNAHGNPSGNFYGCNNGGIGSFTCNPLYVKTDGTNYRLTSNSPARLADSGSPQRDMGALPYLADPTPTLQGVLRQNTTLTAAGSPWVMPGDLVVPAGITLTLEPGATLQPASSSDFMGCGESTDLAELVVQGSLVVNETPANRAVVKPTSAYAGRWGGVRFEPTSTNNSVSGLEIAYGKTCVDVRNPSLTLTNTRVHHCSQDGVNVSSASALTMTGDPGKHGGNFLL